MIEFMLFNVVDRRLLDGQFVAGTIFDVERQADNLGSGRDRGQLSYVLGWYDNEDSLWVDWDGKVAPRARSKAPPLRKPEQIRAEPTPADVDAHTAWRITARYSLTDQLNMIGTDGAADMRAWIDGVREAGHKIKLMAPIPSDFADDRHWPSNT